MFAFALYMVITCHIYVGVAYMFQQDGVTDRTVQLCRSSHFIMASNSFGIHRILMNSPYPEAVPDRSFK